MNTLNPSATEQARTAGPADSAPSKPDIEPMGIAERPPVKSASGETWKIVIADDDSDVHASMRLALGDITVEGRRIALLFARTAAETLNLLADNPDSVLLLLDVVMESERSGLDLVCRIREELHNDLIQIVIVTGQPAYAPEQEVVEKYQINDYRLKTDLTAQKLTTLVCLSIRTHRSLSELADSRNRIERSAERLREMVVEKTYAEERVRYQNELLDTIDRLQGLFIDRNPDQQVFDTMLMEVLRLTESQYGFVDSLENGRNGKPFLQALAISNISWDQETRDFYKKMAPGGMRFFDFDALFGPAVNKGEVVISNFDPDDPRRKNTPKGHPEIETFLAVPLRHEGRIIGVIGVANRNGGYSETMVTELDAVWAACSTLVDAFKSKRELLERKLRIERTLEGTNSGTFTHDLVVDVIHIDQRTQEILGLSDQHPSFEDWISILHPDDRAQIRVAIMQGHVNRDERINLSYRITRKGNLRHIKVDSFVEYEDGKPIMVHGLVQDVTDYLHAKDLLARSQQRYERLVDNLGNRFVVYSQDAKTGELLYLSKSFEDMIGVSRDTALHRYFGDVIDWCPGELEKAERCNAALLSGERDESREEYCFVHPSNGKRYMANTDHLAFDEQGRALIEGIAEDITDKKDYEARLRTAATYDPLTTLLNRREIVDALNKELGRAYRYSRSLAVLLVDLDHFKRINDSFGHLAGDTALVVFARTLKQIIRDEDRAGRYGGEEFLVVLPESSIDEASRCASRLREAVESLQIDQDGHAFRFTVSIGIAHLAGKDDSTMRLLARADKALYQAKHSGRNCVRIA